MTFEFSRGAQNGKRAQMAHKRIARHVLAIATQIPYPHYEFRILVAAPDRFENRHVSKTLLSEMPCSFRMAPLSTPPLQDQDRRWPEVQVRSAHLVPTRSAV